MPRTNKPSNGSTNPRPPRDAGNGNGSAGEHFNDPGAVAKRAYELYLERGGQHGADLDDWLEAERQLKPATSNSSVTGPAPSKPRRRKGANESSGL